MGIKYSKSAIAFNKLGERGNGFMAQRSVARAKVNTTNAISADARIICKWLWLAILLTLIFQPAQVQAYTGQDLWVLEVNVNDSAKGTVDALVLGEIVHLPLKPIADLLSIPVEVASDGQQYTLTRPGDKAKILIDLAHLEVSLQSQTSGQAQQFKNALRTVDGIPYISLATLGQMFNAAFEYDYLHMLVKIRTATALEQEGSTGTAESPKNKSAPAQSTAAVNWPVLTLSGVKYRWALDVPYNREQEHAQSVLNVWADGTIDKWRYRLGGYLYNAPGTTQAGIERSYLALDLNKAMFRLGQGSLQTDLILSLPKTDYTGIALVSQISPLYRMGGGLIDLNGEAPAGSRVKIFVNQWAVGELVVDASGQYLFKDVQLPWLNSINEVKIRIEKPSREVQEIYRYISVSEAILNRGEIDYLAQVGKTDLRSPQSFFNGITYWGVTDRTTLGLSWYGEIPEGLRGQGSSLGYSFNSLRYNQRLSDAWIFNGLFYQVTDHQAGKADTGYQLDFGYKDQKAQTHFEYEKEARTFKRPNEHPEESLLASCVYNLTPYGNLEAKAVYARSVDDPLEIRKTGMAGYKLRMNRWESSLRLENTLLERRGVNWDTSLSTNNSFLITPNFKVSQSFNYNLEWFNKLRENLDLGFKSEYFVGTNSYRAGVEIKNDLRNRHNVTTYNFTYDRRFKLRPEETLNLEVGLEHEITGGVVRDSLPLNLHYSHILTNDIKLEVDYRGTLQRRGKATGYDHSLKVGLEGAFNIFGGKIFSVSPDYYSLPGGIVRGMVYKDINHNGKFDTGELPAVGITVRLDHRSQLTDEQGNYIFKQVEAGKHVLGFDYKKLPIELTASTGDREFTIKDNGLLEHNLGLFVVGAVDGQVYVHGLPAGAEIPAIKVRLLPTNQVKVIDRKGYFFFDQLPPGEYQLSLEANSIPTGIKQEGTLIRKFRITDAGEYVSGMNFDLQYAQPAEESGTSENNDSTSQSSLPPEAKNRVPFTATFCSLELPSSSSADPGETAANSTETPIDQAQANSGTDNTDSAKSTNTTETANTTESSNTTESANTTQPSNTTETTDSSKASNSIGTSESSNTTDKPKNPPIDPAATSKASGELVVDIRNGLTTFNGEKVALPAFLSEGGEVWVPLRAVVQLFGMSVYWNQSRAIVCLHGEKQHILLDTKEKTIQVNGVYRTLKYLSRIIDGVTYVSLRDLSTFGFNVQYGDKIQIKSAK